MPNITRRNMIAITLHMMAVIYLVKPLWEKTNVMVATTSGSNGSNGSDVNSAVGMGSCPTTTTTAASPSKSASTVEVMVDGSSSTQGKMVVSHDSDAPGNTATTTTTNSTTTKEEEVEKKKKKNKYYDCVDEPKKSWVLCTCGPEMVYLKTCTCQNILDSLAEDSKKVDETIHDYELSVKHIIIRDRYDEIEMKEMLVAHLHGNYQKKHRVDNLIYECNQHITAAESGSTSTGGDDVDFEATKPLQLFGGP